MTAWMIMMIVAAGPIYALMDSFGDEDTDDEEEPVPETAEGETPIEPVDAEAPVDQDTTDGSEVNEQSFSDDDDTFVGTDDARHFIDLGAGDDTATGGRLSDIIEGGAGADTISGGGGGDFLYATDPNSAGASDDDADVLDGGAGSDFLYFGTGDTATGGSGGDTFTIRQDLDGNATITDFNAEADTIVFETSDPDNLEIESQTLTDDGILVTLSNGATLTLQGATSAVPDAQITFQEVLGITAA